MSATKILFSTEYITFKGVPATRCYYENTVSRTRTSAVYIDGCSYCDNEKAKEETFFPWHFAGAFCQSGRRNHCTCDSCF